MIDANLIEKSLIKDSLLTTNTKPLYLSQIVIENGETNGTTVLSEYFYNNLLNDVISEPVKSVKDINKSFVNLRKNLLLTELYKDVDILLDSKNNTSLLNFSLKVATDKVGIESVVPVSAIIKLNPLNLSPVNNSVTFNTSLSGNRFNFNRQWINYFGISDTESIDISTKYNPTISEFEQKSINANISLPIFRNQSIRALSTCKAIVDNQDKNILKSYQWNIGFQKSTLNEKLKTLPLFYTGLSFIKKQKEFGPLTDEDSETEIVGTINDEVINEVKIKSNCSKDSRTYVSSFPVSGHYMKLNLEHTLFETNTASDKVKRNISNLGMSYEKHISSLSDRVTSSFLLNGLINIPMQTTFLNLKSEEFWQNEKQILNNLLKKDIKLDYQVGLVSSFKIPNIPIISPLRFQLSVLGSNKGKNFSDYLKEYSADTGVSLVYKGKDAQMTLSYYIPLVEGSDAERKNGLSFELSVKYC